MNEAASPRAIVQLTGIPYDRAGNRALWISAAAVLPALGYVFARYVGFGYVTGPWAYWPINGILCGIFFRRTYRDWPLIGVLAVLSQAITIYAVRGYLLPGGATIIGASLSVVQAMLGAFALVTLCEKSGPLTRARDVGWFVALAVCLFPLVTTLIAASAYAPVLKISFEDAWVPLFAGNSLSILIFAPPVMYFMRGEQESGPWRAGAAERVIGHGLVVVAAILIFALSPNPLRFVVLPYALVPVLAWSATRCGVAWTSVAIVVVGTIAAWCTARGLGPFAYGELLFGDRVLHLQTYLAMLAITAILLSSIWEQARRAFEQFVIEAEIREGFFDGSVSALLLKDIDGRIVVANKAYAQLTGHKREDLIGRQSGDFVAPGESELIRSRDALVVQRDAPMTYDETVSISGKRRHFVITRFPVRNSKNEIRYVGVIGREVTAERELSERLYRAQRVEVVGHLAAGIAHDLNNLLGTVVLSADLLTQSRSLSADDRELLAGVQEAGSRAARLTNRLLSLGRARAPEPVAISVDDTVRELAPMLHVLVRGAIDLNIDLNAPDVCVLADPLTIEQVVLNLVSNARDAVSESGTITLATSIIRGSTPQAAQRLHLRVTDTGAGMNAETQASLFEPFFSTKGDKGTGLGLYTTSLLIRQAQGEISVSSEPGAGTTFLIDLPIHSMG